MFSRAPVSVRIAASSGDLTRSSCRLPRPIARTVERVVASGQEAGGSGAFCVPEVCILACVHDFACMHFFYTLLFLSIVMCGLECLCVNVYVQKSTVTENTLGHISIFTKEYTMCRKSVLS